MKKQIKHLSLWVILLLLNASLAYADAPPAKPLKTLSKKEIRLQKRLKRREAKKLKRRARKVRRAKRFLNSRLGKWFLKKLLKKKENENKVQGAIFILLGVLALISIAFIPSGGGLLVGTENLLTQVGLFIVGLVLIIAGIATEIEESIDSKKKNKQEQKKNE